MAEYIDRKAAVGVLEAMGNNAGCDFIEKRIRVAAKRIGKIPAADVAPITPGRWLNFDELYALAAQELMSGALENEEFDSIINFIDDAPAVESVSVGCRAWIPANKRLPEDRIDVLVVAFWAERWDVYMGWCVAEDKRWYVATGGTYGAVNRGVPVAYWMPLPKLPKMDGGVEDE
mgnify:CR=1 FL=1